MCTVTFIARKRGYALGMNRDENLTRVQALPPTLREFRGVRTLSPCEPSGGTWIGVNSSAVTYALINWYSISARAPSIGISRGQVVLSMLPCVSSKESGKAFEQIDLGLVNPFRLIAVFAQQQEIIEWRWDLLELKRVDHPWADRNWISSGFDEKGAQITRRQAYDGAVQQTTKGSLAWLRRLHSSHAPERGPYSTCMHRLDAATVSYTEIAVSKTQAIMRYSEGAPCGASTLSLHRLHLNP